MAPKRKIQVELHHRGSSDVRCFKFFRGTPPAELSAFIRELLDLPTKAKFNLLDEDGDPVLLNSHVPDTLKLRVVCKAEEAADFCPVQGERAARATERYLEDIAANLASPGKRTVGVQERELLPLLSCTESVSRAASSARRRLLDHIGAAQASRLVFRADMPMHVRQILFDFCTVVEVVRLAEISRGFLAWVSWEGRRVLPIVSDQVLRGGVASARKLAKRIHPSFLHSIIVEVECVSACVFLEELMKQECKLLTSLKVVRVSNTQYVPATLLIRLLRYAGGLKEVSLLTRLDRPLAAEHLRSVCVLETLVLHSTELHGFSSLFTHGQNISRVVLRDTVQLDFSKLLGALPDTFSPGATISNLMIVPNITGEPAGRRWEHWFGPVAELLNHPALAAVRNLTLPAPSSSEVAVSCAEVLLIGFRDKGVPQSLRSIQLSPYAAETEIFGPGGRNDELWQSVQNLVRRWQEDWPELRLAFPGVT